MTGNNFALDTNQAIAILNGRIPASKASVLTSRYWMPSPLVGELLYGALNSTRRNDNRDKVLKLISRCNLLDLGFRTAEPYAEVRLSLKKPGRPIPENDIWIAAACIEAEMPLLTQDAHFQHISGLRIASLIK